MKSFFTLMIAAFFTCTVVASTTLSYNETELEQTFSKLNRLEQMYQENPAASLEELTAHAEFEGVKIEAANLSSVTNAGDLPILPAFWWGCILGAIGILLVYIITEDKDQSMKALWGCLAWTGFWLLLWIFSALLGFGFLWW
jgi:hypothetical protein